MILYHGSNVEVLQPVITNQKKYLDFGAGFYMTSDLDQAVRWSFRKKELTGKGMPTVSIFTIDEMKWKDLNIEVFDSPNEKWLECITANRKGLQKPDFHDLIIGPVADDQTINTIGIYLRGLITARMAIELLLPYKLKDQYCFKTEKALSSLIYQETRRC